MHRRGGKRIRMDDECPPEYESMIEDHHPGYHHEESGDSDHHGDGATPTKGGRMTRLRARGGVRDKPPIIDDDVDEFVPVAKKQKKPPRQLKIKPIPEPKERVERVPKERVERVPKERAAVHDGGGLDDKDVTTDETSLYYILRHSKATITSIVEEWITSYKVDRGQALIALMQFFINASGCKGKIEPQPPNAIEHTAIIRKMTEEFDEESGEYPLIMPGLVWKKFKSNFCDFVQTLVKQCQYSIIYDQFLMDHVISLLTGLSDSQVRAFRHTATLAAMKLMTSLVDVALLVSVNFDNAARQYETERLKSRDKRASDRLESLMTKRTELEENMDEIKNMLTYMFKSVFVHRYRDTLAEIRGICMMEIGVWMQKFSQNFLDDSYLKYIGWTLHDKVGEVRLRCLQALLPLYASDELKGKLELFTSKFKDRIVAMTLDKEFDVAVHAVKLVISILKIHPDILADKDCEIVYELVYSSHRGVAQAAAEFLNVRLFRLDDDSNVPVKTRRGKVRLPNTPLLRDLVQFFIESELHEHGAYLVDSFIDSNSMVKDWECMTDLLLEEPGPSEEPMDNKQESTLIEIMVSSIRQSATGEPPVGRGSNRQKTLSAKEIKQVQDDKQKLTEHFIQTLPALLHRYSADAEKLNNLLAIPQFFELDIYTTSRQEANLQQLLDKIAHIMAIHTDRDVLETCSKTLEFLCIENSAIYTRCDVARSNIVDQCVNKYKEAIDDWRNLIEGEETPDEDEIYNVVISLKKVSILYSCHNLNQWNLFDSLFKDIDDLQSGALTPDKSLPDEALVYCIESCSFAVNWSLYYIENQCESFGVPAAVEEAREKLHKFLEACTELIRRGSNVTIQEAAYMSICDSLIVFSDQLSVNNNNPQLKRLEYAAAPHQVAVLNDFVQQHVFAIEQEDGHDERRIEELHKKRNSLAGFCKLIVYNIIQTKAAADIFKHYLRYYNEYGDIIKSTLGKARELNKVNCAMTMCLSLVTVFKEIQARYNTQRISKNCQEFADLKELAKRFALSFGLDASKSREAITALHRAGILFAVTQNPEAMDDTLAAPPCLLFLEILMELTNKLIKQDKRPVLNFLERRLTAPVPASRGEDWQPLLNYRNALLHGESEHVPVAPKRAYNRRRKDLEQVDEEYEDNDDGDDDDPDYRG